MKSDLSRKKGIALAVAVAVSVGAFGVSAYETGGGVN